MNVSEAYAPVENPQNSNSKTAKYPKHLYDKIFPHIESLNTSYVSYSHLCHVADIFGFPQEYFSDSKSIISNVNYRPSPKKSEYSVNDNMLNLRNISEAPSSLPSSKSYRSELDCENNKLELEDWLDDVL